MRTFPTTAILLLVGLASAEAQDGGVRPLFASDAPLHLTIEAPFRQLSRNGDDRTELDGVVRYRDVNGNDVELTAEIRVRGKSRLELCDFPPLRVDFDRDAVAGTVFAGQNHLKLVTLCKRNDAYRDYLAQEYQIYRAYNLLTDYSFRVRWLSVEYVDSAHERSDPYTEHAFFIEEDWEVAERHGVEALALPAVPHDRLDLETTALLSVFQYLIGNLDWSATAAAADEDCCHNVKPIGHADGRIVVLPYDFDQTGLISTSYAVPPDGLNVRSVRDRRYRGFCRTNDQLEPAIRRINEQRAALEELFGSDAVGARQREHALEYVAEFYEIVNDPEERREAIDDACRG